MIAAVIDDVLEHLPEGILAGLAVEELVFECSRDAGVAGLFEERARLSFEIDPRALKRREIRIVGRRERLRRRAALPAGVPNPFGRVDVHERVANGFEAAAHVARV